MPILHTYTGNVPLGHLYTSTHIHIIIVKPVVWKILRAQLVHEAMVEWSEPRRGLCRCGLHRRKEFNASVGPAAPWRTSRKLQVEEFKVSGEETAKSGGKQVPDKLIL